MEMLGTITNGTPKQIAWAGDIRQGMIRELDTWMVDYSRGIEDNPASDMVPQWARNRDRLATARERALGTTDAQWLIKHRGLDYKGIAKAFGL